MSAIGTHRLCEPVCNHSRCWSLTGGVAPVPYRSFSVDAIRQEAVLQQWVRTERPTWRTDWNVVQPATCYWIRPISR